MRAQRSLIDVSALPAVVFGSRATTWWGMMCFMAIETTTLAICAVSYFYLRKNFSAWPPEGTRLPALLVPTISLLALLSSNGLAWAMDRAAKSEDFVRTRLLLVVATLVGLGLFGLRLLEFRSLNTTWDANAYGSIAWAVMGMHSSLLLMDVMETGGLAILYLLGRAQRKHYVHASENAIYWFFTTLSWAPLYVVVFWGPRFL
ncbi:MAG TPA: cytochrome c oxidase subunit 3 [Gemmatimonadaceae bacterium]|jgi:heme/copper-type cytochrome/quinol oxidase subunit 3|nr:cytochrome c oxidase subunit 3 [Gemmatimonadaceae bacterium]